MDARAATAAGAGGPDPDAAPGSEPLQILDPSGHLVGELPVTVDDAAHLYRAMVFVRAYDRKATALQRQGRLATYAPYEGQEATQIGSAAALQPDDWMAATYRDAAAMWMQGYPLELLVATRTGDERGGSPPDSVNVLPPSVTVGGHMVHAVGLAWAERLKGSTRIALTLFGDGATSEGDFHEAMNFAGVFGVGCVFVCQNNGWAISLPRELQTASDTIADKAVAYGLPGVQVDGNDVLAVYQATHDAVSQARSGGGPTLIEAVTYRLGPHSSADDPDRYRDPATTERWRARDPIERLRTFLAEQGHWDPEWQAWIEEDAAAEIERAVAAAEAMPAFGAGEIFDAMFAELPPHLAEQRMAAEQAGWPSSSEWPARPAPPGRAASPGSTGRSPSAEQATRPDPATPDVPAASPQQAMPAEQRMVDEQADSADGLGPSASQGSSGWLGPSTPAEQRMVDEQAIWSAPSASPVSASDSGRSAGTGEADPVTPPVPSQPVGPAPAGWTGDPARANWAVVADEAQEVDRGIRAAEPTGADRAVLAADAAWEAGADRADPAFGAAEVEQANRAAVAADVGQAHRAVPAAEADEKGEAEQAEQAGRAAEEAEAEQAGRADEEAGADRGDRAVLAVEVDGEAGTDRANRAVFETGVGHPDRAALGAEADREPEVGQVNRAGLAAGEDEQGGVDRAGLAAEGGEEARVDREAGADQVDQAGLAAGVDGEAGADRVDRAGLAAGVDGEAGADRVGRGALEAKAGQAERAAWPMGPAQGDDAGQAVPPWRPGQPGEPERDDVTSGDDPPRLAPPGEPGQRDEDDPPPDPGER